MSLEGSAERLAFSNEVSGVHRLELVPEEPEIRDRMVLRSIDVAGRTPPAPSLGDIVPTDLGAPELLPTLERAGPHGPDLRR